LQNSIFDATALYADCSKRLDIPGPAHATETAQNELLSPNGV